MATQVNPTRMELTRLKKKLVVARRGHKLLKDKRDELMKQFLELVRENKALRERTEDKLKKAYEDFLIASAVMSSDAMEQSLMISGRKVSLEAHTRNIMSVNVPVLQFEVEEREEGSIFPYGFAETSGELDGAITALNDALPDLLKLAEMEKTCQLLAEEIEKTRRRVNALEYVMIPDLEETIRFIMMKLDENERSTLSRLMKVKDMMIAAQLEQKA